MATLCPASLSGPFFQQHLPTSRLCHILVILAIFQTYYSVCYGGLWSVIFDVTPAKRSQLAEGSDDG